MKNNKFKSHILACIAFVTAGNAAVMLPFYQNENFSVIFLTTAVLAAALAFICTIITNFAFGDNRGTLKKNVGAIVASLVLLASFYGAVSTAFDYVKFIKKVQLPEGNTFLITLILALICAAFIRCKNGAVLKTGFLLAVLSQGAVILLFVLSVKLFDFGDIKTEMSFTATELKLSAKYLLKYFPPVLSATAFAVFINGKLRVGTALCGVGIGFFNVLIMLVQSVLVLGAASNYQFPYYYAVNAFSSGNLFYRLGGIVYFVFFSASIVKIAVCAKTIQFIIKELKRS